MNTPIHNFCGPECTFGKNNWSTLAKFWQVIAWSDEVTDAPLGRKLLDVAVVLFRDETGKVIAAHDVCPHRGSLLSLGKVHDGEIECPYHGMRFNGTGKCTMVPSNKPGVKIPERLKLNLIEVAEHANLIWVRLDNSGDDIPLPEWSELSDETLQSFHLESLEVKTSTTRFCENFNDVAHFAFVHAGTFGGGVREEVERYDVVQSDFGLHHELTIEQVDRISLDDDTEETTKANYKYDFRFPFNNKMHISFDAERHQHIFAAVSPISSNKCRLFMQFSRNFNFDLPIETSLEFDRSVVMEDLAVIEKVTPVEVPLDLAEEFSVVADRWSVAFRRRWKKFGLE